MMILTCEKCGTRFEVPERALIGGRRVRCTHCMHIWLQEDPKALSPSEDIFAFDESDENDEAMPVPDAIKPPQDSEARVVIAEDEDSKKLSTRMALVVFLSLFLLGCIVLLAAQKQIIAAWPQSAGLYKLVGIDAAPPAEGLKLGDGKAVIHSNGVTGDLSLFVMAYVVNSSDETKTVPPFDIQLTDSESGKILQSWQPEMEENVVLKPGEIWDFKWNFSDVEHKMGRIKIYFRH